MLSTQRKEFDEKKKDEGPYPRDFSRWYALDYFRRPRPFKSARVYVTLITTIPVTLLCLVSLLPAFHRCQRASAFGTSLDVSAQALVLGRVMQRVEVVPKHFVVMLAYHVRLLVLEDAP